MSTDAPWRLLKTKGPASASPFSPRLDAGVDFYFLAFFAFFFFTIVSSFCSDIGNSEVCLEPINGPNRGKQDRGPELTRPWLAPTTANEHRGPLERLQAIEVRDV